MLTTSVKATYMSQMKHQLDATLCRFYFCRVPLHVSGASAHHQEYLKLVRRPLVRVLSLHVSHHISLLGPELQLPKHVQWLCRNKTCTVLHQVGVSFDLYYDARKHKIKICYLHEFQAARVGFVVDKGTLGQHFSLPISIIPSGLYTL